MNRITLDFYNGNAEMSFDGRQYVFDDTNMFVEMTGFNFPKVGLLSIEIERNLYIVEEIGGTLHTGQDLPAIQWCLENFEMIKQKALEREAAMIGDEDQYTWNNERLTALSMTDWMVLRHRDQVELQQPTTLTSEQYQQLLVYRQQLRDAIPETDLPTPPDFLSAGE